MTLTEQWKKGELEDGWYYVYLKHLEMFDIAGSSTLSGILERGNGGSIEVIAPVPIYDEWKRIFHYAGKYEHEYTSCVMDYEKLKQENQQLKELLKDCREILDYTKDFAYHNPCCKCIVKINQVLGK